MPRKLSDRVKKAAGTFRKGREGAPKPVADAQAAVAAAVKALEAAKRKVRAPLLTPRQLALAQDKVRVCNDDVERSLEDLTKARAVPVGPTIRPGVAEMTLDEVQNADPPLTDDEELEWISPKATIGKPAKYRRGNDDN